MHGVLRKPLAHINSEVPIFYFSDCNIAHVAHLYAATGNKHIFNIFTFICLLVFCHAILLLAVTHKAEDKDLVYEQMAHVHSRSDVF